MPPFQSPNQGPNRIRVLGLLLAALGVPIVGGIGLTFTNKIQPISQLLIWLLATLVYEIGIIIFGFVTKVWEDIEARWVKQVSDWLDAKVKTLFSKYRSNYAQYLIYSHRDFDVKGLSTQGTFTLEIEQVFVDLSMEPNALHKASSNLLREVPENLREGRHTIWDFLQSEQMRSQNLVLIGAPGTGKTTLLKHIVLTLSKNKRWRQTHNLPQTLPILLVLREHVPAITDDPNFSLIHAVQSSLLLKKGPIAPSGWFESYLDKGKCLIMLDGLDEVASSSSRKKVVEWVEQQMIAFGRNRFIVTSRPFGYQNNPLGHVTILELLPFRSSQVRQFIQNWYTANEIMSHRKDDAGVRMIAQQGAEDLMQRLRTSPALAALAVNPLLLTMIATVHRYRSSLPGRRVELYAEIFEVFLGKRDEARGIHMDLAPAQKQSVLEPLAYYMMSHQLRVISYAEILKIIAKPLMMVSPRGSAEEFLKMIENSTGLFLEQEAGSYKFAHLTFQEYLASVHVREQRLEKKLLTHIEDSWWQETLRLYATRSDATNIVAACLSREKPSIMALSLAIDCMDAKLQPEIRARLEAVLSDGVDDPDPERRQVVAQALLELRQRRMVEIYLDEDTFADTSLVSCAEYQLFIGARSAHNDRRQPDHWKAYSYSHKQGHEPAVGVRGSDARDFCEWVSQREFGEWKYRLPFVHELDRLGKETKLHGILNSELGYWVTSKGHVTLSPSSLRNGRTMVDQAVFRRWLAHDLESAQEQDVLTKLPQAFGLKYGNAQIQYWSQVLALVWELDRIQRLQQAYTTEGKLVEILLSARNTIETSGINTASHRAIRQAKIHVQEFVRAIEHATNLDSSILSTRMMYQTRSRASTSPEHTNFSEINSMSRPHILQRAKELSNVVTTIEKRMKVGNDDKFGGVFDSRTMTYESTENLGDSAYALRNDLNRACTLADSIRKEYINKLIVEQARILTFDNAFNQATNRTAAINLDRAYELPKLLNLPESLELYRVIDLTLNRNIVPGHSEHQTQHGQLRRRFLRFYILGLAVKILLLYSQRLTSSFEGEGYSNDSLKNIQEVLVEYMNIYTDLVVLEERIRGTLPTLEGILLIKERKLLEKL